MDITFTQAARHHTAALEQFRCAEPSKWQYDKNRGRYHPQPHVLSAQSMVRSLKPHKLDPDDMLLLGINQRQLLSVVYLRAAEDSVSAPSDDAGYFLIALLAVQIDAQGQGIG